MSKIIILNTTEQSASWQKELANAIKNPEKLLELLNISNNSRLLSNIARKQFPLIVPLPFISKMKIGDINDPLLKQVLPIKSEELVHKDYFIDPLQEHQTAIPGLLHKYKSRVLLIVKSGCAVNCRYCFRRHFPYQDNNLTKTQLNHIIKYLNDHREINEVILSGGDPLMSKDDFLLHIITRLETVTHLKRLRIHTRLPVVIPNRITSALVSILKETSLNVIMVLHINHANEIDTYFQIKINALHQAGVQLLNQSVLLKGVNDTSEALVNLSEALSQAHIFPYYLFVLDKIQGAQHFDIEEKKAKLLLDEMNIELPGYLVPKLSREIADKKYKTVIA
ncbi:MAG: EF-P beta-lysylation protein EpmB [Psychromonas sp.]|nr:EF-P beta-lysylation protein EpmB [Psychromonas sp.]